MTKIIRDKYIEIDPAKKKGYEERAGKFIEQLNELQAHGKSVLKDKKNKKVITQHEAFAYFGKAFGVDIVPARSRCAARHGFRTQVSMGKLIDLCKEKDGPRVIAIEPQYPPTQAEALRAALERHNIHVKIVTLDPLETADIAKGPESRSSQLSEEDAREHRHACRSLAMTTPLVTVSDLRVELGGNQVLRGLLAELTRNQITALSSAPTAPARRRCCGPCSKKFPTPAPSTFTAATIIHSPIRITSATCRRSCASNRTCR